MIDGENCVQQYLVVKCTSLFFRQSMQGAKIKQEGLFQGIFSHFALVF